MRRVFAWLMLRLVRRLRRHRYAAVAARTRALEIELGMVEPTIAEMFAPVVPMTSALAELRSGHARNFFANGGVVIGDPPGTVESAYVHTIRHEKLCDRCVTARTAYFARLNADPRLTTRNSE